MHYSVYCGIVFAAAFGLVAPGVARRISPTAGTWLLTIGGLIAALSGLAGLSVLAMTFIGQSPVLAAQGHWSISALRHADPVRLPVAVGALGLVAISVARLVLVVATRGRSLRAAYQLNVSVTDTGSDVVVLPEMTIDAYAVPGRPGRIFVTRGMLSLLSRDEVTVMLAHERAHLRHHHHWHRSAVALARAINPLLASLPRTQVWLTERWADESAARAGTRSVVATALRRATAATDARISPRSGLALVFSGNTVDSRMAALMAAPPRRRPAMMAIAGGLLTLSVLGTLDGLTDEAALFQGAVSAHYAQVDQPHLVLSASTRRA